ncbi:MAG TPA: cation transporter, partial [Candidatus Saccharimonadales bacterium]|nr:cation transporter [Candidatus Saccharimonadales bacterium]
MQTHVFHVTGMHCKACPKLIEMELAEAHGVTHVRASLWHHRVTITGNFGDKNPMDVIAALEPRAAKHGYKLS